MAEVFVPVPSAFQDFSTLADTSKITLRTLAPVSMLTPEESTTTSTDYYANAAEYGASDIYTYTFPLAPTDLQIVGLGDRYETLQRPGRQPLVQFSANDPVSVSFKALIIADGDPQKVGRGVASAESSVLRLSAIAKAKTDVILVGFGEIISSYAFRITEFGVASHRLTPNQEMSMVDVSLTFTQSVRSDDDQPAPGMILIKDITIDKTVSPKKPEKLVKGTLRWAIVNLSAILGVNVAEKTPTALTMMLGRSPQLADKAINMGINLNQVIAYLGNKK